MNNEIPKMTHPLGKHWDQPSSERIVLDDTHALMERSTFEELGEYSSSIPTGVYEGKMWKRHDGIFDQRFIKQGGSPVWLLVWFGPSSDPNKCSINSREILILD